MLKFASLGAMALLVGFAFTSVQVYGSCPRCASRPAASPAQMSSATTSGMPVSSVTSGAVKDVGMQTENPVAQAAAPQIVKSTYLITGLHCPPCTGTVQRSLAGVKGVRTVSVDWNTKNARIEFDATVLSPQQLANRIRATPHMMGGGWRIQAGWFSKCRASKLPAPM